MDQLKKEANIENDADFFILLRCNLRSSKRIVWEEDEQKFFVINYIDDSDQVLTVEQMMDKMFTNIGDAMVKGSLFKDD